MKKKYFKIIAEAVIFNKFGKVKFPLENLQKRKASIDEIKKYIIEEYQKTKEKMKAKKEMGLHGEEEAGGWGDAELMNHIKFLKALNIKEFFYKKGK
jgi:hypothetical protein